MEDYSEVAVIFFPIVYNDLSFQRFAPAKQIFAGANLWKLQYLENKVA